MAMGAWPMRSPYSRKIRLQHITMSKESELIAYYTDEDVEEPRLRERVLRNWIREVAAGYDRRVGELCYQFCGDERILQTNQDFLDHDYYTDIITFDESEGDVISGDMLISLDTVRSNADAPWQ